MVQVKEVLRIWLRGQGERPAARSAGVDRKTARRYITAGIEAGLERNGDESQLSEALIGQVCQAVCPVRPDGHGQAWQALLGEEDRIKAWVADGLTVTKAHVLLARRGIDVPYRTMARFAVDRCGAGRPALTVRVADPEPGMELQVDFGRMGLIRCGEHRRVCHALIFTACWSRHCFIWLCFSQTTAETITGFESAWGYFGGVFAVVIPDNMSSVVTKADDIAPRINDTFLEYAQSRGFEIDPARVRHLSRALQTMTATIVPVYPADGLYKPDHRVERVTSGVVVGEPVALDSTDSALALGPGHMVLVSPRHKLRGLLVRLDAAEWRIIRPGSDESREAAVPPLT